MSYGNTKTSNLQCDCCGYVGQDSIPGIYYMDMFFKHRCTGCNGNTHLCSNCTGSKSEHNGEWVTECKSCVRNRKIDKIVDEQN